MGYVTGDESTVEGLLASSGLFFAKVKERPVGHAAMKLRMAIQRKELERKGPRALTRLVRVKAAKLLDELPMAMPTPAKDWLTAAFGVLQRSCRPSPTMDLSIMDAFAQFCVDFLPHALRRVEFPVDYSFDADRWITEMDKPESWKRKLRELLETHQLWDYVNALLYPATLDMRERMEAELYSIFQKDESYDKLTATRIIFSLTDFHRVAFGDVCKRIGEQLVHQENMFSGIPVKDWPEIMRTKFNIPGMPARATDFSGFEKWFNSFVKHCVDFIPFAVVAAAHPEAAARLELMRRMEMANHTYRHNMFLFMASSMFQTSGSHKTYSVNTFGHWVLSCFMHTLTTGRYPRVDPATEVHNAACTTLAARPAVFTGDDAKDASGSRVPLGLYHSIGLEAEYEVGIEDDDLAFCKVRPLQLPNGKTVAVPPLIDLLAKLPWTPRSLCSASESKVKAMVKAKCLSYLYQYPSCPVLAPLCAQVIQVCKGIDARSSLKHFDSWERKKILIALNESAEGKPSGPSSPNGAAGRTAGSSDVPTLYHPFQQPTHDEEFQAMEKFTGLPADVLKRVHNALTVGSDLSCPQLAALRPHLEQARPDYFFHFDQYTTDAGLAHTWLPPTPIVDRLSQLEVVISTNPRGPGRERSLALLRMLRTSLTREV